MNDNGYIKSLDGVRAIAILLVMTFHAEITHFGWMGVQLFFVLSGFLITGILWKEKFKTNPLTYKFKKFWVRRTLRIFPLYFGYLLFISIIYLAFHFPDYYLTYIPYLATYTFNYTRAMSAWQGNPLFTHLWSLSIEEQFYLVFPLIIFFCNARFVKYFMLTIIFLAPFIRFFLAKYYESKGLSPAVVADAVYWNTCSHLDAFFMGGIIPVFALSTKIKNPQPIFFIAAFIVIVAGIWNFMHSASGSFYFNDLGYNHGQIGNYEHVWHYTCLNFLFSSFLLLLVNIHTQNKFLRLRRVLENKWAVSIGKVSYGMYIFHWGILVYFYNRFFSTENLALKALLFIPYAFLVYLFASLVYKLYEVHFIKLKDKFFKTDIGVKEKTDPLQTAPSSDFTM
jgi:peptidoglycan/LPS O-acetylase OafA/YrhL